MAGRTDVLPDAYQKGRMLGLAAALSSNPVLLLEKGKAEAEI